jgi:hypothetical protein
MIWMKKQALKKVVVAVALMMPVLGIYRAAQFQFQQKEDAFHQLCRAEMTKLGLNADAARAKYPTPEIHMVTGGCILPGATGEVVIKGKFAPGTKFFFENDSLEVVTENLSAGVYRATLKSSPGIPPQSAAVAAISPVSGIMTRHSPAVSIGGKTEWNLQAANGWKIVAKPQGAEACGNKYVLQFFRGSETQPFEKREGTLSYDLYTQSYNFSISAMDAGTANTQETLQSISKKLMEQMQKVQQQMVANMQAMVKDPAKMAAKEEQFGCRNVYLDLKGGALQGRLQCSQTVGRNIALTGSFRLAAQ